MVDDTTGTSPAPDAKEVEDTTTTGNPAEGSSNETTTGIDATSGQPSQDAKTAESSDAGKDAKDAPPRKLLDVVKDAAGIPEGKDTSSVSEDKKDPAKAADPQKVEGDGDLPPFHKHPRWIEQQEKIKTLEPAAAQFQRINEFMNVNKLDATEVAEGFKIMALIKNEPERALVELERYSDSIKLALGKILPADLQDQVDKGYITEEKAKELSATKQRADRLETELTETKNAGAQRTADDALNELKTSIRSATTDWETQQKKADPDYSVKQRLITDRARAIVHTRGYGLESKDDAVKVLNDALKDVTESLKSVLPKRNAPIRKETAGGNVPVSAGGPKTLKEAVMIGASA